MLLPTVFELILKYHYFYSLNTNTSPFSVEKEVSFDIYIYITCSLVPCITCLLKIPTNVLTRILISFHKTRKTYLYYQTNYVVIE